MKDFFTRYHETRKHHYILPAVFGVMFAFAIVAQITWTRIDLRSLQANVLEAGKQKIVYNADLIMEKTDATSLSFRIGKSAENVEALTFSVLGNPEVLKGLSSESPNTSIKSNEPGIFLVKVALRRSITAGEIITVLYPTLTWDSPLALIDAGFTSSWTLYSLSVKSE